MLWKAADCGGPSFESRHIKNFGWKFRDEIPIPVIAEGNSAPPELLDVIQCQCKVQGKAYVGSISSSKFCNCRGEQDCLYPFSATTGIVQSAEEITDADDNDRNLPGDSDDDLEQNIEELIMVMQVRTPCMSGRKEDMFYHTFGFLSLYMSFMHL